MYYIKVLVPQTKLEDAQKNTAYADQLTKDFESRTKKTFEKPGSIQKIEISDLGLLKITFSSPLVDDAAAVEIAKSFLILKLRSNTETDPSQKTFTTEVVLAKKNEI
jgi:hypothetical protein